MRWLEENPLDVTRWSGGLLIAGLVVFFVGAVLWRPAELDTPVLANSLRYVANHRLSWLWIHGWMGAAC